MFLLRPDQAKRNAIGFDMFGICLLNLDYVSGIELGTGKQNRCGLFPTGKMDSQVNP